LKTYTIFIDNAAINQLVSKVYMGTSHDDTYDYICARARVCVCVEREREREREKKYFTNKTCVFNSFSKNIKYKNA